MAGRRRRFAAEVLRRVWKFVALFFSVYLVAAVLFFFLEPHAGVGNSLYWAIVTLSTTGYGDLVPTSANAKAMTSVLLFGQIFLGGYLVSVITSTVIDESQKEALGTLGTDMANHIVVLGYSGVGQSAVRELLSQDQIVAVVADSPEQVANIRSLAPAQRLFATYGAAAEPEILRRVNVVKAHSVIACTSDDATNMIASLNIRALAPQARIVVSVQRAELRDTLRNAGVTYVASPSEMGGRLCASAAFEHARVPPAAGPAARRSHVRSGGGSGAGGLGGDPHRPRAPRRSGRVPDDGEPASRDDPPRRRRDPGARPDR
ncbi:MAG: NAD-binding protein, partial [Thermoplasmata archaeon]|nr:NAD-binding protein [Thermoplasmata archaeon]